jgi:hypothetical protein
MYVQVDVELTDFDAEDLVQELQYRGYQVTKDDVSKEELVESIYLKRRLGQNYQAELDQLIYKTIGKIL